MRERFGEMFKRLRIDSVGQTLRAFCLANGFDAGNISKLERGRMAPPESVDILTEYACALGLEDGSEEWTAFFDLAAAERGKMPADLMEDEQLLSKLPVLFRALRDKKANGDDLDELVKKIRQA